MRRGIAIAMVIFGIWAVISGISQFFPPFTISTNSLNRYVLSQGPGEASE